MSKSVVRTDRAGCFFAEVADYKPETGVALLKDARRLWYWKGAASLSQLAVDGVKYPNECKFPVAVPEVTVAGVIEIIPATEKAIKSVDSVPVWSA